MKKIILVAIGAAISTGVYAQKSKVRDAEDFVTDNRYKKAMPIIEEAVASDETKNYPKAWFIRGRVYYAQATDTTITPPESALDEATKSFEKAIALKPDYDPADINNILYATAIAHFNRAVEAGKAKRYDVAYKDFLAVSEIYNINGGKRYATNADFMKTAGVAKFNAGIEALYGKMYPEAEAIFLDLKDKQTPKDSNTYQLLIEVYQNSKNDAKFESTVAEARQLWPNSQYFRDAEIRYYQSSGKSEILLTKLEDAVKKDPNNGLLTSNLADMYEKMAYPKDDKNKDLPRPANFTELYSKTEPIVQKLVQLSPDDANYNYIAATLYFNNAVYINKEMQNVGVSASEQKKYDALMAQRNAEFKKAQPYFDKCYSILDKKGTNLSEDETLTLQNTIYALQNIYQSENNKPKLEELKAKSAALKGK